MPYNNTYTNPHCKEAYERGYTDAQYLGKNWNPYHREDEEYQAYEYGYDDWFRKTDTQQGAA